MGSASFRRIEICFAITVGNGFAVYCSVENSPIGPSLRFDAFLRRPGVAPADPVGVQRIEEQREAADRHAGRDQALAHAADDLKGIGARPRTVDHPVDQFVDGFLVDPAQAYLRHALLPSIARPTADALLKLPACNETRGRNCHKSFMELADYRGGEIERASSERSARPRDQQTNRGDARWPTI